MKILMISSLLLLLLDSLNVQWIYRLLFSFLIGKTNRKHAEKIHAEQTAKDRFTLYYIRPKLTKYRREFDRFHRLYKVELLALLPQYAVIAVLCIWIGDMAKFVLYVLCAIKFILFIWVRSYFDGNRVSCFAKK